MIDGCASVIIIVVLRSIPSKQTNTHKVEEGRNWFESPPLPLQNAGRAKDSFSDFLVFEFLVSGGNLALAPNDHTGVVWTLQEER